MAYIIQLGKGAGCSWITSENPLHGDPARTLIKSGAKRYRTEMAAKNASDKIVNDNFQRFKGLNDLIILEV